MKIFKLLVFLPIFGFAQPTESMTCPAPNTIGVNIIRCDSVELSWISDAGTTSSMIEWDTTGFVLGSGNGISGAISPTLIAGLTPNTSYNFYVKDSCANDTSNWIGPFTFNTGNHGTPTAVMNSPVFTTGPGTVLLDATPSIGVGNIYVWNFGDGSPLDTGLTVTHDYLFGGTFNVMLMVSNACGVDTAFTQVVIVFDGSLIENGLAVVEQLFFPNPANNKLIIDLNKIKGYQNGKLQLEIYTSLGQRVLEKEIRLDSGWRDELDISQLNTGNYLVKIFDSNTLWNSHVLTIMP